MSNLDNVKEVFEAAIVEHEKFIKGNNAAGTRARKAFGELAKLCKVIRNEVTEEKNKRKEAKESGK